MKRLLLAFGLTVFCVASASAFRHGGPPGGGPAPPPGSCPYGSALGDGCPGAQSNSTTQILNFFVTAPQNGQSYQTASFTGSVSGTTLTVSGVTGTINPNGQDTLCPQGATCAGVPAGTTIVSGAGSTWTLSANLGSISAEAMTTQFRPAWNVAGVDYPVGPPPDNTLTDPATLHVCSGTTFPLCINPSTANQVEVVAPNSGSDVVIDHYNFGLHGGYNVMVMIPISGNFTVTNSKFVAGSAFQAGGSVYQFYGNSCGNVMLDTNSRSDLVSGVTTLKYDEFDGRAATGSTTIGCPGSSNGGTPAVFNLLPSGPSNSVIVEYSYFHDYNPRIQFGYGATIKYNLLGNNNYNTLAHGELTAFNELCGTFTGCPGVSTIDMEYNTIYQNNNYCGGQTAPVFMGSGINSGQVTDYITKNDTTIDNGCTLNISVNSSPSHAGCAGNSSDGANCQITFTTTDGGGGVLGAMDLCLTGNASTYVTCPATLTTQISGTTGSGGVWRYAGELTGSTNFQVFGAVTSEPSYSPTGETGRNVDSENNYVDPTGTGNFSYPIMGDCGQQSSPEALHPPSGSITSANNKLMGSTYFNGSMNDGQLAFATCEKYFEAFMVASVAGTTLTPILDATFTGDINVTNASLLTVSAISSGTIQTGVTDNITDAGGAVLRGSYIINQSSGSTGSTGTYTLTNPLQTVSSETMRAIQFFGIANGGGRTDTLVGTGVGAGITITSGSCTQAGCTNTFGLSSSPGTLSNRNLRLQVP